MKVHVERIIQRLKRFRILSQTVPIDLSSKMAKILRICAALCNLRCDIIHEDAEWTGQSNAILMVDIPIWIKDMSQKFC